MPRIRPSDHISKLISICDCGQLLLKNHRDFFFITSGIFANLALANIFFAKKDVGQEVWSLFFLSCLQGNQVVLFHSLLSSEKKISDWSSNSLHLRSVRKKKKYVRALSTSLPTQKLFHSEGKNFGKKVSQEET